MKAASEPFTRSYLSPTMITRLFLSRCLDWHQVCRGRISSFSHRNQTAFSLTILFVIYQHAFNARAAPYPILTRSIPPLLQQRFTRMSTIPVQYLSHPLQEAQSSFYKPSQSSSNSSLFVPFSLFPFVQFHQSPITSLRYPHTRDQLSIYIPQDVQKVPLNIRAR